MSDYPRDLVNKAGKVQEFKRKEDVPPGWFVRDTGEEVNPTTADVPPAPKGKGAAKMPAPQPKPTEDDPGAAA